MISIPKRFFAVAVLYIAVAVTLVPAQVPPPASGTQKDFLARLSAAAIERTQHKVRYDPAYVKIAYPNGDVPADTGVCSDEVIRSYRALGVDLQKEVHEDMQQHRSAYPFVLKWRQARLDTNIDHRRVPNLMAFFARNGQSLPITRNPDDYAPGDIIAWNLGGDIPHIGLVVDQKSRFTKRYMIVHNIGSGPQMEDVLFEWKIIGHYRYFGPGK